MNVILDKSYLDGETSEKVFSLCERHTVMMPDVLFYELLTTDDVSRVRCFSKIPRRENPLVLIPNVGQYLRFEMERKTPCYPIHMLQEDIQYKFNDSLREKGFVLSPELQLLRQKHEAEVKEDTKRFVSRSFEVLGFFKETEGLDNTAVVDQVESLIDRVATDHRLVQRLYDIVIPAGDQYFPYRVAPERLGKKWAIYRWVQTQIIYGLMFFKKYKGGVPATPSDKFWRGAEHDMIDAHYVLLGSLVGAIATRDHTIRDIFKKICPKGFVFGCAA